MENEDSRLRGLKPTDDLERFVLINVERRFCVIRVGKRSMVLSFTIVL